MRSIPKNNRLVRYYNAIKFKEDNHQFLLRSQERLCRDHESIKFNIHYNYQYRIIGGGKEYHYWDYKLLSLIGINLNEVKIENHPLFHLLGLLVLDGNLSLVSLLIINGIDPNSSKDDWTPLHFAVANGNYGITKYLLESGADATIKDDQNHIPYQLIYLHVDEESWKLFEDLFHEN